MGGGGGEGGGGVVLVGVWGGGGGGGEGVLGGGGVVPGRDAGGRGGGGGALPSPLHTNHHKMLISRRMFMNMVGATLGAVDCCKAEGQGLAPLSNLFA